MLLHSGHLYRANSLTIHCVVPNFLRYGTVRKIISFPPVIGKECIKSQGKELHLWQPEIFLSVEHCLIEQLLHKIEILSLWQPSHVNSSTEGLFLFSITGLYALNKIFSNFKLLFFVAW
jgi:hypothetical protein